MTRITRHAHTLGRRRSLAVIGAALAALVVRPASALTLNVRDAVIAMTEGAAETVREFGFPRALNKTGWDVWYRSDLGLYVYVLDRHGNLLMHPDRRAGGRNVMASHDAQGTPFIRNIIEAATATPGHGVWTRYQWADARSGEPGTKHTYSIAVKDVIVSVGYVAMGS